MRGNIQGLLAQAQKMQKNVERLQAELGNIEVTGEAGAGAVKITITCKHEARRVEIDPKLLSAILMTRKCSKTSWQLPLMMQRTRPRPFRSRR